MCLLYWTKKLTLGGNIFWYCHFIKRRFAVDFADVFTSVLTGFNLFLIIEKRRNEKKRLLPKLFPICQLSHLIKSLVSKQMVQKDCKDCQNSKQKWSKYGYRKKWPLFGTQICQNDMYFNSVSLSCRGAEVSTMELNLDASVQMRWWKKIHHMLRMQYTSF